MALAEPSRGAATVAKMNPRAAFQDETSRAERGFMSASARLMVIAIFIELGCASPTDSELTSSSPEEMTGGLTSADAVPFSVSAVCNPRQTRRCCPYPNGCSCLGITICDAAGNWDTCEGASRRGQPCQPL